MAELSAVEQQQVAMDGGDAAIPAQKLIVIIPAYNEQDRVGDTILAIRAVSPSLRKLNVTMLIYVIDDGSDDATIKRASQAGADRIVRHKQNRGLGAAVRSGLLAARSDGADFVVKIDADLQHDPNDIAALLGPLLSDEADLVYGNRFSRIQYRMPLVRRVGNYVFRHLMCWLTKWPLKDSQPGIFAASRAYLEVFNLPGDYNYTQQILLDAYHNGMRFAHVDVAFRNRETGKSFISMRYPLKVLPQIFWVIVGIRPLRIFGPLGALFLGTGSITFLVEIGQWLAGQSPKPVMHVNLVLGSILMGIQTLFFGIIAQLIIQNGRRR